MRIAEPWPRQCTKPDAVKRHVDRTRLRVEDELAESRYNSGGNSPWNQIKAPQSRGDAAIAKPQEQSYAQCGNLESGHAEKEDEEVVRQSRPEAVGPHWHGEDSLVVSKANE